MLKFEMFPLYVKLDRCVLLVTNLPWHLPAVDTASCGWGSGWVLGALYTGPYLRQEQTFEQGNILFLPQN